jgi:hypothetical protein
VSARAASSSLRISVAQADGSLFFDAALASPFDTRRICVAALRTRRRTRFDGAVIAFSSFARTAVRPRTVGFGSAAPSHVGGGRASSRQRICGIPVSGHAGSVVVVVVPP